MTDASRPSPHPDNTLNELSGEEWLYFTKSVLTTAYPSELGHAARKVHGANKPPRLMARLIEFFSRTGELVLDPFAGVGGTLLGAAIARGPRRALGIELDPRWVGVYREVVAALQAESDGRGPTIAELGTGRSGRPARTSIRAVSSCAMGDALEVLPELADASVDFVATDPPYNIQLPLDDGGRRPGGDPREPADRLRDGQRCSGRSRQCSRLRGLPRRDGARRSGELARVLQPGRYAVVIVRDAYQNGRYQFVGADLAARAEAAGLVPKGDLIWHQAGTRLRPYGYPRVFVPNIAHQHILVLRREPGTTGQDRAAALEVGREDVAIDVVAHRPGIGSDRHRRGRVCSARADRRRPHRGSSCGSSPAGHRGTAPASRRRASRAAGPRHPDRGTPSSAPRSSSGMSSRRTRL